MMSKNKRKERKSSKTKKNGAYDFQGCDLQTTILDVNETRSIDDIISKDTAVNVSLKVLQIPSLKGVLKSFFLLLCQERSLKRNAQLNLGDTSVSNLKQQNKDTKIWKSPVNPPSQQKDREKVDLTFLPTFVPARAGSTTTSKLGRLEDIEHDTCCAVGGQASLACDDDCRTHKKDDMKMVRHKDRADRATVEGVCWEVVGASEM